MASNSFYQQLLQWALFGLMFTTLLSTALPFHKHRRHLNRRLFLNNYGFNSNGFNRHMAGENAVERVMLQNKDAREIAMRRNKMRNLNILNPNLLIDKTTQYKNTDARFYRMNALSTKEIRSTPLNENSMGSAMKKILLRMN